MVGRFVIVRCRDAGVHCGVLRAAAGRAVELGEARRVYSWRGANTLNELAIRGCGPGSRISEPVETILLLEACEVIPCTDQAAGNLRESRWSN